MFARAWNEWIMDTLGGLSLSGWYGKGGDSIQPNSLLGATNEAADSLIEYFFTVILDNDGMPVTVVALAEDSSIEEVTVSVTVETIVTGEGGTTTSEEITEDVTYSYDEYLRLKALPNGEETTHPDPNTTLVTKLGEVKSTTYLLGEGLGRHSVSGPPANIESMSARAYIEGNSSLKALVESYLTELQKCFSATFAIVNAIPCSEIFLGYNLSEDFPAIATAIEGKTLGDVRSGNGCDYDLGRVFGSDVPSVAALSSTVDELGAQIVSCGSAIQFATGEVEELKRQKSDAQRNYTATENLENAKLGELKRAAAGNTNLSKAQIISLLNGYGYSFTVPLSDLLLFGYASVEMVNGSFSRESGTLQYYKAMHDGSFVPSSSGEFLKVKTTSGEEKIIHYSQALLPTDEAKQKMSLMMVIMGAIYQNTYFQMARLNDLIDAAETLQKQMARMSYLYNYYTTRQSEVPQGTRDFIVMSKADLDGLTAAGVTPPNEEVMVGILPRIYIDACTYWYFPYGHELAVASYYFSADGSGNYYLGNTKPGGKSELIGNKSDAGYSDLSSYYSSCDNSDYTDLSEEEKQKLLSGKIVPIEGLPLDNGEINNPGGERFERPKDYVGDNVNDYFDGFYDALINDTWNDNGGSARRDVGIGNNIYGKVEIGALDGAQLTKTVSSINDYVNMSFERNWDPKANTGHVGVIVYNQKDKTFSLLAKSERKTGMEISYSLDPPGYDMVTKPVDQLADGERFLYNLGDLQSTCDTIRMANENLSNKLNNISTMLGVANNDLQQNWSTASAIMAKSEDVQKRTTSNTR
jgi:hypothetical protein